MTATTTWQHTPGYGDHARSSGAGRHAPEGIWTGDPVGDPPRDAQGRTTFCACGWPVRRITRRARRR